jgi:hypothetical protein
MRDRPALPEGRRQRSDPSGAPHPLGLPRSVPRQGSRIGQVGDSPPVLESVTVSLISSGVRVLPSRKLLSLIARRCVRHAKGAA